MNPPLLTQIGTLLTLLITLSISAERLVAIMQNLLPFLRTANPDATKEGWRRALLQILAVLAGLATVALTKELLPAIPLIGLKGTDTPRSVVVLLGFLTSGGSGFWTSILGYVNGLKDVQKNLATTTKMQAVTEVATAGTTVAAASSAAGTGTDTAQGAGRTEGAQKALLGTEHLVAGRALPTDVAAKLTAAVRVAGNNL